MATNIMPIVKFYVSKNSSRQGTVVDFASESLVAALVDFTAPANQGKQFATVIHQINGNFIVTYSDQAGFNASKEARLSRKRLNAQSSQDVAVLESRV